MTLRKLGVRWVSTLLLGTVAPLVTAQITGTGGPGMHGQRNDDPASQACRKQADDQKLPRGEERQKFMRQCMESKRDSSDAAKSAAARAKMGDPQSGHLHSDPPPPDPKLP